jgi:centromere protein I
LIQLTESVVSSNNPESFQLLTAFYTSLLRNWILAIERDRTSDSASDIESLSEQVAVLHMATLASPCGTSVESTILRYYEVLAAQRAHGSSLPQIVLPNPHLLSLLIFSPRTDSLSRLCAVMANYKEMVESNLELKIFIAQYVTDRFNGFILDMVDLLWRSRALSSDSKTLALVCQESFMSPLRSYLQSVDREFSLSSLFGLSHSVALSSLSLKAFQDLEDAVSVNDARNVQRHVGPVTQHSLTTLGREGGITVSWKEYRLEVLDWLESRGLSGVKELMYMAIKDLRGKL